MGNSRSLSGDTWKTPGLVTSSAASFLFRVKLPQNLECPAVYFSDDWHATVACQFLMASVAACRMILPYVPVVETKASSHYFFGQLRSEQNWKQQFSQSSCFTSSSQLRRGHSPASFAPRQLISSALQAQSTIRAECAATHLPFRIVNVLSSWRQRSGVLWLPPWHSILLFSLLQESSIVIPCVEHSLPRLTSGAKYQNAVDAQDHAPRRFSLFLVLAWRHDPHFASTSVLTQSRLCLLTTPI